MKNTNIILLGIAIILFSICLGSGNILVLFVSTVDNASKLLATVEKMKATNLERRGVEFPSQDPEVIKKMRESSKKKYVYEGLSFDSSWELAFYIMNKDAGHKVIREPLMIPYESRGITYYYIPDFSVNGSLYEMKGSQLIKDG